ncbi:MAG: ABC transporter permease [Desulfurococcaceae archaeon]
MIRLSVFKTLMWKEVKEITRDRKLVVTTIIIPLLSLPAIAVLTALLLYYQPVVIAIVNSDVESGYSAWFVENLSRILSLKGYLVNTTSDLNSVLQNLSIDLIVVVPTGFSNNITSFHDIAYVEIIKRTGVSSERVDKAEQDVRSIISILSNSISEMKIKTLAEKAGVSVNVDSIRNPIQVKVPVYVGPMGEPVKPEDVLRPFIARLLILSFTFIVTPASSYIVDGIVGERERKTIEMLMASTAGLRVLLVSKLVASTIIGVLASAADLIGLFIYFGLLIYAFGEWFALLFDLGLIAVHVVTAFFSILVTVSVSMPFITRTRGIKTASNIASLMTLIGLAFFLTGWIVDFYKLPSEIVNWLKLIPYTHSVLSVQSYVYRDYATSLISILILATSSLVILAISLKSLEREKVLLAG